MNEHDDKSGKILPFRKPEGQNVDADSVRMLKVADEIDEVILRNIGKDMDARDLAGLLAHRLGTLMRNIDRNDREVLWLIIQKVLREQADLGRAE